MSDNRLFSARNPWFAVSLALTIGLALLAVILGFAVLPELQPSAGLDTLWTQICRAAGVVEAGAVTAVVPTGYRTSEVTLTPGMLHQVSPEAIGRGATFALRCTMCHGARGLSQANAPNLAGQYPAVIYKQLSDYKSGARTNVVMTPLVANLSEQDMRELAAYYAYLPRLPSYHPAAGGPAPEIVISGAPMRNIAPCGSCHGGLANKTGSAWLEGQPEAYLQEQLRAFKSGARHNDISEQMRNVARNMTSAEIDAAAHYYASQPGDDAPEAAAASR